MKLHVAKEKCFLLTCRTVAAAVFTTLSELLFFSFARSLKHVPSTIAVPSCNQSSKLGCMANKYEQTSCVTSVGEHQCTPRFGPASLTASMSVLFATFLAEQLHHSFSLPAVAHGRGCSNLQLGFEDILQACLLYLLHALNDNKQAI